MTDELAKIDRWNSEPLDVHRWSDHPEIKALCDYLYTNADISSLEPKGNHKPKRTVKESLRVLILDLYVKWLKDPSISIGFSKTKKSYKVGSRYNGLYIPEKIIEVEDLLVHAGYIEELPYYHSKTGQGRSYTTRIRHTKALRDLFEALTMDLHDIDTHANEECIILHDKYVDNPDDDTNKKIEYSDKNLSPDGLALVNIIRGHLQAYNSLLKRTFIDIPSYTSSSFVQRQQPWPVATTSLSGGSDRRTGLPVCRSGSPDKYQFLV